MPVKEDKFVLRHRKDGLTGLELESFRVTKDGRPAKTPHPFGDCPYIDRDFAEPQIEINTTPLSSPQLALDFLRRQLSIVQQRLSQNGEILWPFSNPPIIADESDIPIAKYVGQDSAKSVYREYLSNHYGRYMMTFSGIHFNYSFDEQLLQYLYERDQFWGGPHSDFRTYKDNFYLRLAGQVLTYSWAVVALLAASPLFDVSFFDKGTSGQTIFNGLASTRCSSQGYWNSFVPILSYQSVASYTDSIEAYIRCGMLRQESELYYPVRLKPAGKYSLDNLRENGINHIELRMLDLNPLSDVGIMPADIAFIRLLLIYLASQDAPLPNDLLQLQSLQNHKNAAAFDWDIARITLPTGDTRSLSECLHTLLDSLADFYQNDEEALTVLRFQAEKVSDKTKRYAYRVRQLYGADYIGGGIRRAEEIQRSFHV